VNIRSHLSDGSGFVQVNKDYLGYLVELIELSPSAAQVWIWLLKRADRRNSVHMATELIAEGAKVSRRSLFRALDLLEYNRWIGRNTPDRSIHLNAKLVWSGKQETIGMAQCLEAVGHPKPVPVKRKSASVEVGEASRRKSGTL
jgi:hypothetical protein